MASKERNRGTIILATLGGALTLVFALSVGAAKEYSAVEEIDPNECVFIDYQFNGETRHFPIAQYMAASVLAEVNKGNIGILTNELICDDIENQGTLTTPTAVPEVPQSNAEPILNQPLIDKLTQLPIGANITVTFQGKQYQVVKLNQKMFKILNNPWYAKKNINIEDITAIVE